MPLMISASLSPTQQMKNRKEGAAENKRSFRALSFFENHMKIFRARAETFLVWAGGKKNRRHNSFSTQRTSLKSSPTHEWSRTDIVPRQFCLNRDPIRPRSTHHASACVRLRPDASACVRSRPDASTGHRTRPLDIGHVR